MSEIEELRAQLADANQLKQECGRSLKGLLEWSQKADVALEKSVEALENLTWWVASPSSVNEVKQALALARPLLKTRPERN